MLTCLLIGSKNNADPNPSSLPCLRAGRLNKTEEFPLSGEEGAGEILKKSLFNYGFLSGALMSIRRKKGIKEMKQKSYSSLNSSIVRPAWRINLRSNPGPSSLC